MPVDARLCLGYGMEDTERHRAQQKRFDRRRLEK